jgi:hypothetical protein
MLFKPELLAKVLSGEKVETRRIAKESEVFDGHRVVSFRDVSKKPVTKWRVGSAYAACPGRGKVQQGRFCITRIRLERLDAISEADARAEGFANRDEFLTAWDSINGPDKRDVSVWVLTLRAIA